MRVPLIFLTSALALVACEQPLARDGLLDDDTAADTGLDEQPDLLDPATAEAPLAASTARELLDADAAQEGELPPPPPAATDCDNALYYGSLAATNMDSAASYAYKNYLLAGGGSDAKYAWIYLESAKGNFWRGYWALSRSGDEAGAEYYWLGAYWDAVYGQYHASISCSAGRAHACTASTKATAALNYLNKALAYLDTASCP